MIPDEQKRGLPFGALRRRAAGRLAPIPDDAGVVNDLSPEEIRDLIEELRVHQVELEMQNEELLRVQGELERARDRYGDLYDFAPVGYLTLSDDRRILEANLACVALLGVDKQALIHRSFPRFVVREDRLSFQDFLRQLFAQRERRQCELRLKREAGEPIPVRLDAVVRDPLEGEPAQCRVILIDISDHKRMQSELQLAAKVFDNSLEGIVITAPDGRIQRVNRAFTLTTGYAEAEVAGQRPSLFRSGRHDSEFHAALWRELEGRGRWQGEIWNRRKNGELYPQWLSISAIAGADGEPLHYVGIFSELTGRTPAGGQLRDIANYDQLTGLPGRQLFQERLKQALMRAHRDRQWVALLFLDLDRFKGVNDTLGHAQGDLLLQEAARRLSCSVRETDTVARLGGDEFTLILGDLPGEKEAVHCAVTVAEKTAAALARPLELSHHRLRVGASIGIALYPRDGETIGELLRHADGAMYHAKSQGRGNHQFHSEELQSAAGVHLAMESDLRAALAGHALALHYQPQVDLASGALVGVEALLRWDRPGSGPVAPDSFIPVAEDSGLILPIGEWVLESACRQNRAWQAAGLPAIPVAVNLSGRQFCHNDLVATVQRVLESTGLAPEYLELEITEGIMMREPDEMARVLGQLNGLGVQIAMDDFGTGYSSLARLKDLPIDTLKIDRSFLRDLASNPENAAIVVTIIAMARSLQLRTVAEGVEEEGQLAFLRRRGCDSVQGFLTGRPVPPGEILHRRSGEGGRGERDAPGAADSALPAPTAGALQRPLRPTSGSGDDTTGSRRFGSVSRPRGEA